MSRVLGSDRASNLSVLTTGVYPARAAAVSSCKPGRARFVPVRRSRRRRRQRQR